MFRLQYHEQYKAAAVSTANTQALIQPEEVRTSETRSAAGCLAGLWRERALKALRRVINKGGAADADADADGARPTHPPLTPHPSSTDTADPSSPLPQVLYLATDETQQGFFDTFYPSHQGARCDAHSARGARARWWCAVRVRVRRCHAFLPSRPPTPPPIRHPCARAVRARGRGARWICRPRMHQTPDQL